MQMYGQEKNNSSISMARMNMFIHDIQDANIKWGDTLANPQHLDSDGNLMKFDCIVANMPFSLDNGHPALIPAVRFLWMKKRTSLKKGRKKNLKWNPGLTAGTALI